MKKLIAISIVVWGAVSVAVGQSSRQQDPNELLFEAARAGDVGRIETALAQGGSVNATTRYGVTPLIAAASNGHLEAVRLLVSRGANVNAQDNFYRFRAAEAAALDGHIAIATFLLQNGAEPDNLITIGVQRDSAELVQAALARRVSRNAVQAALQQADRLKRQTLLPALKAALDALPADAAPAFTVDPSTLGRYVGSFSSQNGAMTLAVTLRDGSLFGQAQGQRESLLVPVADGVFRVPEVNATLTFSGRGGLVESIELVQGPMNMTLTRVTASSITTPGGDSARKPTESSVPVAASVATSVASAAKPRNWPSFRGDLAAGNGDGQRAVSEWDVTTGRNVQWKTAIPGIANSSPIVWGTRIFVTTAISKDGDKTFRTGLYGDVKPVDDLSEHEWKIYAIDKATGKIQWERTAWVGAPKTKRHPKASQANSTPATDGRRVVAAFGSIGLLIAWDFNGKELWRANTDVLDSGWFFDPTVQWGHASSPIIYRNSVILQSDVQKGSYIAAWDLGTGRQIWKTERADEIPTWGTPAIVTSASGRAELVTNGTKIRGYDPATGQQLWTLGPNSEVTVGTPVSGHGLVFVTGGYPPVRPIYAIRPGVTGDISLPKGSDSSDAIAWSTTTDGTYIPTPIVYGDHLWTMNNNGVVNAYDARTGRRAFRGRIGEGGAFSASPIIADGRLYAASEDGEIHVVSASPGLASIAKNDMKEIVMATPAISDGLIIVRTLGHVYGIGQK